MSSSIVEHLFTQLSTIYQQRLSTLPLQRWVIAYSGGVDSTVLLHAVTAVNALLPVRLPIIAIHINHQLSDFSDQWQSHCQTVAESLGAKFITRSVSVKNTGEGLEGAARQARYQAFESLLENNDCLLLGQHQEDQAETVLLRLMRGAGVRGLSAMPVQRKLSEHTNAILCRPLLGVDKQEIVTYANTHQLTWVNDESNANDDIDRNYLRHHILPVLKQRWPAASRQLVKITRHMADADALVMDLARLDLERLDTKKERWGYSLDAAALDELSPARQCNVLRHWCESLHYPVLEETHLSQIRQQLFAGESVSSACVSWKGHEFRSFARRLYIMQALPEFSPSPKQYVLGKQSIVMEGAGQLLVDQSPDGLPITKGDYHIRWRHGGERCQPHRRGRSQTLKKLFQEYGLETWLRDRVPLIYQDNTLVAVGDLWVNEGYQSANTQSAMIISWRLSHLQE